MESSLTSSFLKIGDTVALYAEGTVCGFISTLGYDLPLVAPRFISAHLGWLMIVVLSNLTPVISKSHRKNTEVSTTFFASTSHLCRLSLSYLSESSLQRAKSILERLEESEQ